MYENRCLSTNLFVNCTSYNVPNMNRADDDD